MEEERNQRQIAEEWAKITIEQWVGKIRKLRIGRYKGSMQTLEKSFAHHVVSRADGSLEKIELAYAWYGKMVDLGVGKGVKSGEVKSNKLERKLLGKSYANPRVPKRWQSKTLSFNGKRLGEILDQHYTKEATKSIKGSINQKIEITF